jgi:dienelactone hydrolase
MNPSVETRARAFVGELAAAQWDHPETAFDGAMSEAAPRDKLHQIWKALEAADGEFRMIDAVHVREASGYRVVDVVAAFARGKKILRITFDKDDKVAGFFIQPVERDWTPPPYANQTVFEEREVKVGTSPELPATLTLPKGRGPFPAIVLVHGSGPNDRDESIGGVKPFKDLAWGLATRGIAVLRYEKRSRVSPVGIVTQKDEVETPAQDAIHVVARTPGIDSKRIFLLGHSQGGYLAPRIAVANANLAGAIILAGSTRPLEESLVDQLTYFLTRKPDDAQLRAKLEAARSFKTRIEAPGLRPDEDVALPLGGSIKGAYFLDVRGYNPPAVAKTLTCPLLILQGDRDYQVTAKDFEGWKASLQSRATVTLKTYPTLNHLFVSGSGAPGPEEYERPGHVDETVITDIASWIGARS